ncbi:MAG: aminotransferase class V-fold PLP-dependent enzyme [Chloroflexi bacterium]|nr:aminotransferase class V-fold PLP-dependent enzyme [Chloroflexota bacterium]
MSVPALRDQFLLDPSVLFLNHGSFGACPKPVFETYQRWQLELERQPVQFLGRRADALLDEARGRLSDYLGASPDGLVFVPNATVGMNIAARGLKLQPGDEILTTDHEYGAIDKTWQFLCGKTGAVIVRHKVEVPVTTHDDFVESLWSAVTPRTRVISISHITSPTALRFPVEAICRRAREAGILTLIDGAHAPGQIPLDMEAIGADFYTGNCHKWLCAPKGAGFLYARPEHHAASEPLVVSWGWSETASFVEKHQWQGTRDIASFLSVPAAIDFQAAHDWESVRDYAHELVRLARRAMSEATGLEPISPDSRDWFVQMAALPIPACDGVTLQRRLYDEHRIEIPYVNWNGRHFLRVSAQAYTTADQIEALVEATMALLPQVALPAS